MGLRSVFDILCAPSGFVYVGFALALGVAREKMGYITAVASAACIAQMMALILANYVRDRKRFVIMLGVIERLL